MRGTNVLMPVSRDLCAAACRGGVAASDGVSDMQSLFILLRRLVDNASGLTGLAVAVLGAGLVFYVYAFAHSCWLW